MRDLSILPQFDPGSFRDPDSRVFLHNGVIYRCLSTRALADWRRLHSTAFLERFTRAGSLVETVEVPDLDTLPGLESKWAAVLRHQTVPFISYPYEWPFGMLKDAALLQLDLTLAALEEGMILKDATSYNVQWFGTRPTFIDLGSLTIYQSGDPWAGYRQFCNQFLYPLFLQAYKNVPYHPWLRGSLEGIEADECRSIMSPRDYLRPGVLAHVYLQAKAQSGFENTNRNVRSDLKTAGFGIDLIKNNIRRLRRTAAGLTWNPPPSTWSEYATGQSYDDVDLRRKLSFVQRVLEARRWPLVWDLGCNTGVYSRLAANHAEYVVALDADHLAVDRMYGALRQERSSTILPLVGDVADPSPGLGWRGLERRTLEARGSPTLILCLALIHHLVIGRNIPLRELVGWLAGFGADVIIEFVGPGDAMVDRLLLNRSGPQPEYDAALLEQALAEHFASVSHEHLESGTRTLYYAVAQPQ